MDRQVLPIFRKLIKIKVKSLGSRGNQSNAIDPKIKLKRLSCRVYEQINAAPVTLNLHSQDSRVGFTSKLMPRQ